MAIGILALMIGIVFSVIGCVGVSTAEQPEEKKPVFPYPTELISR